MTLSFSGPPSQSGSGAVGPATPDTLGAVKICGTPTDPAHPEVVVREYASATYAQAGHTHAQSDVTGLPAALSAKVDGTDPRLSDARTPTTHTHAQSEVTGLTTALSGKVATTDPRLTDARTPTAHTHAPSEITGTAVITSDSRLSDARTPTSHTHAQADVTGLSTALSGKVDTSDARLTDARTPTAHTHAQSEVTGLVTALSGKAPTSHTHAPSDVTGTAVITTDSRLSDARTPLAHTHTKSQITDFAHTHPASELTATGTPSATTFLRGDNTWAAPAVTIGAPTTQAITSGTAFQPRPTGPCIVNVLVNLTAGTTPTVKCVIGISATQGGTYTTVAQCATNFVAGVDSTVMVPSGYWVKATNTLTGTGATATISGQVWAL